MTRSLDAPSLTFELNWTFTYRLRPMAHWLLLGGSLVGCASSNQQAQLDSLVSYLMSIGKGKVAAPSKVPTTCTTRTGSWPRRTSAAAITTHEKHV